MGNDLQFEPRQFQGVTISSTFTDLKEHRAALIKAINTYGLHDVAMENDYAKDMDIIDSSMQMVRDGAAYICIIGMKYGQVPECPIRNPQNLSITELEFNEAQRLNRPVLLFIMSENHLIRREDIERDIEKEKKLQAFKDRARKMTPETSVHRVYDTFESIEEFKEKTGSSIAGIRDRLKKSSVALSIVDENPDEVLMPDPIPMPPTLYAKPRYIGSHKFVGRESQLDTLNDWARPADPHSILLFEAIGGNGKSMLTWEWITNYATKARNDWQGIFWYSFYEKGAVMADFCRHALAYITRQPMDVFSRKKTRELKDLLILHLNRLPWLIVLDGLERVLVAYHRIDAAEIPDEELNTPTDKIVSRDPCSCINNEDDELLRELASAAPSKLLVSSRLAPRVLFNASGQPIPGVQRIVLQGLRPADAEVLFRSCGIIGNSESIQNYLITNCDCHPLTIGVLAGLINNYLPDKGNFDAWITDASGGEQLNLANLDLIQKRNHILKSSFNTLSEHSRRLLSTLALLSEPVDYKTLSAFNPHVLSEPEEVSEPENPELKRGWKQLSEKEKEKRKIQYETNLQRWKTYQQSVEAWRHSVNTSKSQLAKTIRDLELRGLLQYDHNSRRYDLHPVVRGIAVGGLLAEEKEQYGKRVVDHFSSQAHNPYEQTESLEEIRNGLNIVRTLLKIGHYQEAFNAFQGDLARALLFNLEAHNEILALIRPFFSNGWETLPAVLNENESSYLANIAALSLDNTSRLKEGLSVYGSIIMQTIKASNTLEVQVRLRNVAANLSNQNLLASETRILDLSLALSAINDNLQSLFMDRLFMFTALSRNGQWSKAEDIWNLLDPMGRSWSRAAYRPGTAEHLYAQLQFWKGDLKEEHLRNAERLAVEGKNRVAVRSIHRLKGAWHIEKKEWLPATESLNEALRMARAAGHLDISSETWLVLAKYYLNELPDPVGEAERLTRSRWIANRPLTELWYAIGNYNQAKKYALQAYKLAWANGEPYVHRYELNKTTELLRRLNAEVPKLPPYNLAKDIILPWEDKLVEFIEKQKAEKEEKKKT